MRLLDAQHGGEIGFLGACIRGTLIVPNVPERMMIRKTFGLAGICAALLAVPASAHHSFAIFDQSKVLFMSGTVKQFDLVNPHAWLQLAVVNDKNDASTWSFEGGSPSELARLDWSKDILKIGDKVQVGFRPMKDGSRGGQIMSVTLANGHRVCSNRGCGDGTGAVLAN